MLSSCLTRDVCKPHSNVTSGTPCSPVCHHHHKAGLCPKLQSLLRPCCYRSERLHPKHLKLNSPETVPMDDSRVAMPCLQCLVKFQETNQLWINLKSAIHVAYICHAHLITEGVKDDPKLFWRFTSQQRSASHKPSVTSGNYPVTSPYDIARLFTTRFSSVYSNHSGDLTWTSWLMNWTQLPSA